MFSEIQPDLYMLRFNGYSSNAYFLRDSLTLIDSGLVSDASFLESSLKTLGVSPSEIKLVLFTHGHADHIGGSKIFSNAVFRMSAFDGEKVNGKDSSFTFSDEFGESVFPEIKDFFRKNETISLGSFSLRVIEIPGHTKGSVCFFDKKNKLLFSGDTLFNGAVGRHDLPSGNKVELKKSLQSLSKLGFELLLPGHGELLKEKQAENLSFCLSILE